MKKSAQQAFVGLLAAAIVCSPVTHVFAQDGDETAGYSSEPGVSDSSAPTANTQPSLDNSAVLPLTPEVTPTLEAPTVSEPAPNSDSEDAAAASSVSTDPVSTVEEDGEDDPPPSALDSGPIVFPQPVVRGSFNQDLLKIDKNTGALNNTYPINVPRGRNGLQPNLDLIYSSQNSLPGSIFGKGWSINIPYVELVNKRGTDKLYNATTTTHHYTSSIDGEIATTTTSSLYIAQTDNGAFNRYIFSSSTWAMTDKNGIQYTFGSSTDSQQNDPNNSENVYRWMLSKVVDTNGNNIIHQYFKDSGQVYPSSTIYTGNASEVGVFRADFSRISSEDNSTSSRTGFGVKSNYRVSEINIKVNGSLVRKYSLAYSLGSNGGTNLLSSITEVGYDGLGSTSTLPASVFSYQAQLPTWTQVASSSPWTPPTALSSNSADMGVRVVDVNGDALSDIIYRDSVFGSPYAYVNNGNGWTSSSTWTPPTTISSGGNGTAFKVLDVNGDGLTDLIYKDGINGEYAHINNGSGWTASSTWIPPYKLSDNDGDYGVRMTDVNGDGLLDFIFYDPFDSSFAFINNGNGWTQDNTWIPPNVLTFSGEDYGLKIFDANGDGLPDLIYFDNSGGWSADINNGHGWTGGSSWRPTSTILSHTQNGYAYNTIDANGDGLSDIVYRDAAAGINGSEINNATGWTSSSTWNPDYNLSTSYVDNGARYADLNGDGLSDILFYDTLAGAGSRFTILKNRENRADVLTGISYPQGGSTTIQYKPATQFMDDAGNITNSIPYSVYVVSQLTANDGSENVSSSSYNYASGTYYFANPFNRQVAGFNVVSETDSTGNVTKTYYHTANGTDSTHGEYSDNFWKIGKPYRVEQYDASGNLYRKTINKWDSYDRGSGAGFAMLAQIVESTYDGTANHKDTGEAYTFNTSTGNLAQKIQYGEVTGNDDGTFSDTGSDKFTTDYTYAASTTVTGAVASVAITDQGSSKVKEAKYYYDSLSFGNVDKGNQTKEENWIVSSTYVNVQRAYNGYGLVTQATDPRGKQTSLSYDSHNLYPATSTEPHGHSTRYTYDYATGKVASTTDPNGSVFLNIYDGLGRLKAVLEPDPSATSTLVTSTAFTYTDTSGAVSVRRTDYLSATNTVDSYTYFDGLGRKVQAKRSAEGGNFKTSDITYNSRGLPDTESLPYFSGGSAKSSATTTSVLYTRYTYDPLRRPTTIGNAVGTTTHTYNNWKKTVTDARGKPKDHYQDAYGNLIQVDEHNGSSTYSTLYTYDGLKNLTRITDALGNVRNFTYDGLGRRISAEDLHAAADTTYGSSTYAYDDAGNLTQTVDPKNQTVNYTYDDLNRVLTEDYTGEAGTELTYVYDTCVGGKKRLCSVSSSDVYVSNAYNALGELTEESKTIAGSVYTTSYSYDRQGNQLTIVNPDGSAVGYEYNAAGLPEKVRYRESGESFADLVNNFNYAPTDQVASTTYANGVVGSNTYDPAAMYRLTRKVSTLPDTSKAQDITYAYDAVGNITQLVDASNTGTGKAVYYTYDDLNRLLTASSTGATTSPNYLQTFTYNAIGNITTGPLGTYTYEGNTGSSFANPHAVTGISISTTTISGTGTSSPALDAVSTDISTGYNGGPATKSWTHTISTSSTLLALMADIWQDVAGAGTVASATWKGTPLTKSQTARSFGMQSEIWYLASPSVSSATGTMSVTVTGATDAIKLGAASFSGIATSSPLDATSTATGADGAPSSSIVTATPSSLAIATLSRYTTAGATSSKTSLFKDHAVSTLGAGSYQTTTSAGTYSDTYTGSASADWSMVAAAFKPGSGGGSGTSTGTSTTAYAYDNSGNLTSWRTATNTWNYRNRLTQSVASVTSSYAYDHLGQRVKLVEGGISTVFPSKFYNVAQGSATTTTKHIFANGLLVATIESASSTIEGGGVATTSTPTLNATSTSISTGFNGGPAIKTWTHAVSASTTLLVLAADIWQDSPGVGTVATATWKGVPLVKAQVARSFGMQAEIWYLATPSVSTATGTVSVTVTGATDAIKLGALSFSGIATSSPLDATSTATSTANNPTLSITTATSSDLVIATLSRFSTTNATSNRQVLFKDNAVSTLAAGSYQTTTSAGVYSDTYTGSSTQDWAMVMAAFKAGTTTGGGAGTTTGTTTIRYVLSDNLGGSSLIVDDSGNVVETIDYYPYGQARMDTKVGSYAGEKRKYIGQEYDAGSGLSYLNARYYDNVRGQFVSQDPIFWILPAELLTDPQQQSSYSYARNNPIVYMDPGGLLTIVVPGTAYDKKTWSADGAAKNFIGSVGKTFNEVPHILEWSGGNSKSARQEAANSLINMIEGHDFAQGERLNIIGHSHGGNIGILVSQMTDRKIDNLVTLGTPVRADYQPNYSMVGAHINAYSSADPFQIGGGQAFAFGGIGLQVGPFMSYGFIPAGRKFNGAENISVTKETGIDPAGAHFDLWRKTDVWSRIERSFPVMW